LLQFDGDGDGDPVLSAFIFPGVLQTPETAK